MLSHPFIIQAPPHKALPEVAALLDELDADRLKFETVCACFFEPAACICVVATVFVEFLMSLPYLNCRHK